MHLISLLSLNSLAVGAVGHELDLSFDSLLLSPFLIWYERLPASGAVGPLELIDLCVRPFDNAVLVEVVHAMRHFDDRMLLLAFALLTKLVDADATCIVALDCLWVRRNNLTI